MVLFAAVTLTSCLKDEGFEDGTYQTINANTEGQEWFSIPRAVNTANTLGVESKAGNQTVGTFVASYDFKDPAPQDITGTLVLNNALVAAADPSAVILPTNAYSIPSLNITVKSGQRVSDPFPIVMNTSLLDPSKKYGIGFTLTSVSKSGVGIPSNLKNVVYIFTIKNRFDGVYSVSFRMEPGPIRIAAGQGSWAGPYKYAYEQQLRTTGPNSVAWINTAFGPDATFHPLMTPSPSGFGSTAPLLEFDANNKLINVTNGVSSTRTFRLNPAVTDSRYDPATKTVYAAIIMDQTGFDPLPIFDTLKFIRAR